LDDNNTMLATIYLADGKRVGMELGTNKDSLTDRAKLSAKFWGAGASFKIWQLVEIKEKETT
jgi:hypothetical protein